jgi:hypothetical protein
MPATVALLAPVETVADAPAAAKPTTRSAANTREPLRIAERRENLIIDIRGPFRREGYCRFQGLVFVVVECGAARRPVDQPDLRKTLGTGSGVAISPYRR